MSKIDKLLKKEAKRTHDEILARSDDKLQVYLAEKFPQNIQAESGSEPKPRLKWSPKFAFAVSSIFVIVIALIVSLVTLLPPNDNGGDEDPDIGFEKEYLLENETALDSTLLSLNSEMEFAQIIDNTRLIVSLIYDSVSGDHLYYYVECSDEDGFETMQMRITVNADYDEKFEAPTEPLTVTINGLQVKYKENVEIDEDFGLYFAKSNALIMTEKEHIYITYEAYSFDESSNFLNWLEQIITAK